MLAALLTATNLLAQAPPVLELSSVKTHIVSPVDGNIPPIAGNRLTMTGYFKQLVIYAYDLKVYQLIGAPVWSDDNSYDIIAKAEGDETLTQPRARELLQALLADRFQLKVHRETKEVPIYALVIGKSGLKMKENTSEITPKTVGAVTLATIKSTATKQPISLLVRLLAASADRPVLDQTGLTGFYNYTLEYARDPSAAADSPVPSLFTAIQEQLGLKLESQKGSIEVLVIDHAEKPSAN